MQKEPEEILGENTHTHTQRKRPYENCWIVRGLSRNRYRSSFDRLVKQQRRERPDRMTAFSLPVCPMRGPLLEEGREARWREKARARGQMYLRERVVIMHRNAAKHVQPEPGLPFYGATVIRKDMTSKSAFLLVLLVFFCICIWVRCAWWSKRRSGVRLSLIAAHDDRAD